MPKKPLLLIAGLALLAGCVGNPYKRNYTNTLSEKVPKGELVGFVAQAAEPKLLSTTDIGKDAVNLLEQGYFPIGRAKFREQRIDGAAALMQAREVGADIVLVKQQHVGTETYSMPVSDWTPDRTISTNETARTTDAATNNTQIYEHQSTTVVEGEFSTHYETQTLEYYDHTAVFWKKTLDPTLGVFVSDLDDAQRKALQSNKGALVEAVVRRSPAFLADLFRGDILRRFAGEEVLDAEGFLAQVQAHAGQTVDIELIREGQALKKSATLKAR